MLLSIDSVQSRYSLIPQIVECVTHKMGAVMISLFSLVYPKNAPIPQLEEPVPPPPIARVPPPPPPARVKASSISVQEKTQLRAQYEKAKSDLETCEKKVKEIDSKLGVFRAHKQKCRHLQAGIISQDEDFAKVQLEKQGLEALEIDQEKEIFGVSFQPEEAKELKNVWIKTKEQMMSHLEEGRIKLQIEEKKSDQFVKTFKETAIRSNGKNFTFNQFKRHLKKEKKALKLQSQDLATLKEQYRLRGVFAATVKAGSKEVTSADHKAAMRKRLIFQLGNEGTAADFI